jgi:hypothetical protein
MATLRRAFHRNVFSHVPAAKVREVSHMLKAIHAQETRGTSSAASVWRALRSSSTRTSPRR